MQRHPHLAWASTWFPLRAVRPGRGRRRSDPAPAPLRRDRSACAAGRETLDPAAWGSDHVGQAVPEYMESGECLFCHRDAGRQDLADQQAQSHDPRRGEQRARRGGADEPTPRPRPWPRSDLLMGDTRAPALSQEVASLRQGRPAARRRRLRPRHSGPAWMTTENPHWDTERSPPSAPAATPRPSIPRRTPFRPVPRLLHLPRRRARPNTPTTPS